MCARYIPQSWTQGSEKAPLFLQMHAYLTTAGSVEWGSHFGGFLNFIALSYEVQRVLTIESLNRHRIRRPRHHAPYHAKN
jgi:hypothetical protein